MTLVNSRLHKGIRAQIYRAATSCCALYVENKVDSIYYDNDNLMVRLNFETSASAVLFANNVYDYLKYFGLVDVSVDISEVVSPSSRVFVMSKDYISSESESEEYSIAITIITHVTNASTIDEAMKLVMIENPLNDDFVGLDCYKCHLKSQTRFPECKDNPNNYLWMSWSMHQRFDGLNTTGTHRVPLIAIRFVSGSGNVEDFQNCQRERVTVCVECIDGDNYKIMASKAKAGSRADLNKKTVTCTLFVQNAREFEEFLMFKYQETKSIWEKCERGMELSDSNAHILRRSVRLGMNSEK
jgi:hypothetical protein